MAPLKTTTCACGSATDLKETSGQGSKKISVLNGISVVFLFFFPKCPLCWAGYASLFSFIGLERIDYNANWRFVIIGLLLIGSFLILRKHYLNKSWLNLMFYGLGLFILLLTSIANLSASFWLYIILFLILLSNFSKQTNHKLIKFFRLPSFFWG